MKILVVDDSLINLKVATKILEKEGYEVDNALSGSECLKMVKEKHYDLIFMDIMMPEMDGVETFKRLKQINDFKTPVITLTADVELDSEEKYLDLGFTAYLEKPINIEKLRKIISNIKN